MVKIISAYSCLGKTTAANMFRNNSNVVVLDMETTVYRDDHPEYKIKDEWIEHYIDDVISRRKVLELNNRNGVILTSAHYLVRNVLSLKNEPFIYLIPSGKRLEDIRAISERRYHDALSARSEEMSPEEIKRAELKIQSTRNAMNYLKSDRAVINLTCDMGEEIPFQTTVVLPDDQYLSDYIEELMTTSL